MGNRITCVALFKLQPSDGKNCKGAGGRVKARVDSRETKTSKALPTQYETGRKQGTDDTG